MQSNKRLTVRREIENCPSQAEECLTLTRFKTHDWTGTAFASPKRAAARHPLLPDDVRNARLLVVGFQPGGATGNTAHGLSNATAYGFSNANASPLGWMSGRILAEWLGRAYLGVPSAYLPTGCTYAAIEDLLDDLEDIWPMRWPLRGGLLAGEGARLDELLKKSRTLLRVYGTNILKCHLVHQLDENEPETWPLVRPIAGVCSRRYLRREVEAVRPWMVLLLGGKAIDLAQRRDVLGLRLPKGGSHKLTNAWLHNQTVNLDHHIRVAGQARFYLLTFQHPGFYARGGKNCERIDALLPRLYDAISTALTWGRP